MDIEYWERESGASPIKEEIDALPVKHSAKIIKRISYFAQNGLSLLETQYLKKLKPHPLYELRIEFDKMAYRILFGFVQQTCWLLHFFKKKKEQTPIKEIRLALSRLQALTKNKF